jgi:hypothetical protein
MQGLKKKRNITDGTTRWTYHSRSTNMRHDIDVCVVKTASVNVRQPDKRNKFLFTGR